MLSDVAIARRAGVPEDALIPYGTAKAKVDITRLDGSPANGWDQMPVCISKIQYSFSDDPAQLGAPAGCRAPCAGFIVALTGDVMTMPGLPKKPSSENVEVDAEGRISGLF